MSLKNAAEEAARVRSSYFAYLSHELRSPLTAVRGSSEIIATRSHDAKLLDHCARIERNVDHISAIIEQILRYARYEAGELTLCKSLLDVADELRDSFEPAGKHRQASRRHARNAILSRRCRR